MNALFLLPLKNWLSTQQLVNAPHQVCTNDKNMIISQTSMMNCWADNVPNSQSKALTSCVQPEECQRYRVGASSCSPCWWRWHWPTTGPLLCLARRMPMQMQKRSIPSPPKTTMPIAMTDQHVRVDSTVSPAWEYVLMFRAPLRCGTCVRLKSGITLQSFFLGYGMRSRSINGWLCNC